MNAECKTIVSLKEHLALNRGLFKIKTLPVVIIYNIIVLCLAIVFCIFKYYWMTIFLSVVALLYTLFVILINKYNVKKAFDRSEALKNTMQFLYHFSDEDFSFEFVAYSKKSEGKIKYKNLYRVIEDKEYFFLFVNHLNAYIVIKDALNKDDIDMLKKILKANVKKFRKV